MNPNMLDNSILQYATGWSTAYLPRGVIGLFGLVALIVTLRVSFKRECSALAGFLGFLLAGISIAFALFPEVIIQFVIQSDYLNRMRFIIGGLSFLVLSVTLESIRRTHLQERYALLWVASSCITLICAVFPNVIRLFGAVLGIKEYVTAVAAVALTFLVLLAFHFSTSLSSMGAGHSKTAQRTALLEARIRELEKRLAAGPDKAASTGKTDSTSNR
jgi:hypothetical protein